MERFLILKTKQSVGYELVDSGEGKKLERYGQYTFSRPDPEALWKKNAQESLWNDADLRFVRKGKDAKWLIKPGVPKEWSIALEGMTFLIRPTTFKHTGLFPEQAENWKWISKMISQSERKVSVLNLFGYTGGATLAAAKVGAEIVHVDGSKTAIAWARQNAALSGLEDKPIRWILDDVKKFLKREAKRGNKYDAIVMDPPSFGHGPKNELWKIEEDFLELMDLCKDVLSENPVFFLINGYGSGYSPISYANSLKSAMEGFGGSIEMGELAIEESKDGRLLPAGIFARWSAREM